MSHIKHDSFVSTFGMQMQKLDKLGCPKEVLLVLAEKCSKLWEEVRKINIPEIREEYYSFIPVIPLGLVPIEKQLGWIGIDEQKGIPDSIHYEFGESVEPYFITSVFAGNEYVGASQFTAQKDILRKKRFPLSDIEMIALCLFIDKQIFGKQIEALGVRYFSENILQVPWVDQRMTYFGWSEFSKSWTKSNFPSRGKIIV
ncbi:hypothetical protein C4565_04780 [Candidatus Parcubacteria bacterium]|jgi:hypothetical protein|nr:MAG: hypothetical protein C4565_04780 [Candidatus Parcubacteria bacterium]